MVSIYLPADTFGWEQLKKSTLYINVYCSRFLQVEEMYAPDLLDFVYITDGASTAEDVKACELKILSALKLDQFIITGMF